MVTFQEVIIRLQGMGLTDVLLPFVLIFTIVFAILQKVHPLGEAPRDKPFNVVIALVMALAVVIPHVVGLYPADADVVVIINKALPNVAVVLVAVVMVLLLVGLFGGKPTWGTSASGWVAILAFLLVLYIFGRSAGWFSYLPYWLYWLDNPDTRAMLLVVAVFALIIWFITKEPGQKTTEPSKILEGFKGLFGGK
ncbi:hypothetical protein HY772_05005 [Candidatus Woesearchaeota archaeon]|nr:hypothetical protein [Candidatus Woesearchaeota archaeon]